MSGEENRLAVPKRARNMARNCALNFFLGARNFARNSHEKFGPMIYSTQKFHTNFPSA